MKLHSPQFEKLLRRGIRLRIKDSPALTREYRNARRARRRQSKASPVFRLLWSFIPGTFAWLFISKTHHAATGIAIINLWTFLTILFFVPGLLATLFKAPDLLALNLLPVRETVVVRWEMEKFFKRSALPALLDQVAAFGAMALCFHFSWGQWIGAMGFAVLSWAMLLSVTALLAAHLPNLPYQTVSSMLFISATVLLFGNKLMGPAVLRLLDMAAPDLNVILPTGWAPSLFQSAMLHGDRLVFFFAVPVVLVLATVTRSLRLLRGWFVFRDSAMARGATGLVPQLLQEAVELADDKAGSKREQISRAALPDIEQVIGSRAFLAPAAPRAWLENQLWNWLSPQEKIVAEFAFPAGLQLTKPWFTIFRNFLATCVAGFALGMVSVTAELCVFAVGLFIVLSHSLLQILSNGAGFRAVFNSGVRIPIYAVYPIGYRELNRTLFKVAAVQFPLFLAVIMGATQLAGQFVQLGVMHGVVIGFRIGFLVFAGRFITTTMAFSSNTNDTTRLHWRTVALAGVMLLCFALFILFAILGVVLPDLVKAWACWLAAMFDAYAFFRLYGWYYHRNWFDLMNVPRN